MPKKVLLSKKMVNSLNFEESQISGKQISPGDPQTGNKVIERRGEKEKDVPPSPPSPYQGMIITFSQGTYNSLMSKCSSKQTVIWIRIRKLKASLKQEM